MTYNEGVKVNDLVKIFPTNEAEITRYIHFLKNKHLILQSYHQQKLIQNAS